MRRARRAWLAVALATLSARAARAGTVALTFDDLPFAGRSRDIRVAERSTAALLAGLRRHHLPATGFVNEIQLATPDRDRRIGLLTAWLKAGEDLGNHSYSHFSLTTTPVETYIADVERGQQVTGALLAARGRREHWFRHPYLETGPTLEVRQRFQGWLAAHGYTVAPVTMENSDWQFAPAYEAAKLAGNAPEAARLRASYLDFTDRTVGWYQTAAHVLLGREPPFVFLMHASILNADSVDALAAILKAHRLRGVTLGRALADPAYRIKDNYAGPEGQEWLSRWSTTLNRPLPWDSLPHVPDDIASTSERLDAAPAAPAGPTAPRP